MRILLGSIILVFGLSFALSPYFIKWIINKRAYEFPKHNKLVEGAFIGICFSGEAVVGTGLFLLFFSVDNIDGLVAFNSVALFIGAICFLYILFLFMKAKAKKEQIETKQKLCEILEEYKLTEK